MKKLFLSSAFLFFLLQIVAQERSPILFIYDASGSMWGQLEGKTKQAIATSVLTEAVNKLPDNQGIGLVAYGHRQKGNCEDVETLVELGNTDKNKVVDALKRINPLGKTPLAYSADLVIDQLRSSKRRATIILITDGIESCDGDICTVIKTAKQEGIDFKLHVVGFGLKDEETESLKCAANAGGGQYYDANNADGLSQVIEAATHTTVDDPDPNYSVYAFKNGQPIDAIIQAYKTNSEVVITSARTYADTGFLYLPEGIYDLKIKPLAGSSVTPITLFNVESVEGRVTHKTVSFDGGKLNVLISKNGKAWDATVKVVEKASSKRVAGGRTYGNTLTLEVTPGEYDVEIKALKMNGGLTTHLFEGIEVVVGETTPLNYDFITGELTVSTFNNEEPWDCSIRVYTYSDNKNVATSRTYGKPKEFILNVGTYNIKLQAMDVNGLEKTITINGIEVKANQNKEVDHNFESGDLVLSTVVGDELIDATIAIYSTKDKSTNLASGRTYGKAKIFKLTPGAYVVKGKALKVQEGKVSTMTVTVKAGEVVESVLKF